MVRSGQPPSTSSDTAPVTPSASSPSGSSFFPQPYRIPGHPSPSKRARYTSVNPSRPSSSSSSLDLLDLHQAREESVTRLFNSWDNLKRYVRPLDEDDIVDITTGNVIKDRGMIRNAKKIPFGGFTEALDGTDADEDEDEEDSTDELDAFAVGDDGIQVKVNVRKVPPVRTMDPQDAKDLDEFLREERKRKELYGDPDDDSDYEIPALKGHTETPRSKPRRRMEHVARKIPAASEDSEEGRPASTAITPRRPPEPQPVFISDSEDELGDWTRDEASMVYLVREKATQKEDQDDSSGSEVEFVDPPQTQLQSRLDQQILHRLPKPRAKEQLGAFKPLQLQTPPLSHTGSSLVDSIPSDDATFDVPPSSPRPSSPLPPSSIPPSSSSRSSSPERSLLDVSIKVAPRPGSRTPFEHASPRVDSIKVLPGARPLNPKVKFFGHLQTEPPPALSPPSLICSESPNPDEPSRGADKAAEIHPKTTQSIPLPSSRKKSQVEVVIETHAPRLRAQEKADDLAKQHSPADVAIISATKVTPSKKGPAKAGKNKMKDKSTDCNQIEDALRGRIGISALGASSLPLPSDSHGSGDLEPVPDLSGRKLQCDLGPGPSPKKRKRVVSAREEHDSNLYNETAGLSRRDGYPPAVHVPDGLATTLKSGHASREHDPSKSRAPKQLEVKPEPKSRRKSIPRKSPLRSSNSHLDDDSQSSPGQDRQQHRFSSRAPSYLDPGPSGYYPHHLYPPHPSYPPPLSIPQRYQHPHYSQTSMCPPLQDPRAQYIISQAMQQLSSLVGAAWSSPHPDLQGSTPLPPPVSCTNCCQPYPNNFSGPSTTPSTPTHSHAPHFGLHVYPPQYPYICDHHHHTPAPDPLSSDIGSGQRKTLVGRSQSRGRRVSFHLVQESNVTRSFEDGESSQGEEYLESEEPRRKEKGKWRDKGGSEGSGSESGAGTPSEGEEESHRGRLSTRGQTPGPPSRAEVAKSHLSSGAQSAGTGKS